MSDAFFFYYSDTCQKIWGGKHVDILRFRTDARKLILESIGTPLTT